MKRKGLMIAKYLFSIILAFLCIKTTSNWKFTYAALAELFLVFSISNFLVSKKKYLGIVFNDIFMLLLNVNMLVLLFASNFVTIYMLENIGEMQQLSGKGIIYLTGSILVIAFSFLPIVKVEIKKVNNLIVVAASVIFLIISLALVPDKYYPIINYGIVTKKQIDHDKLVKKLKSEDKEKLIEYYKDSGDDYRELDSNLSKKPNVVLILTEGLSQEVVDDSRNYMKNVQKFQKRAVTFENYYDHIVFTYKALTSQLFSGYQLANIEENNLISIQSVMRDNGYHTIYINVEPNNKEYVDLIDYFDFDEVIGEKNMIHNSFSGDISDKDAYKLIRKTIEKYDDDKPFFIVIYTVGTHVSLDSSDEKFGNGKNAFLNRFYDMDYQFGKFIDWFDNSDDTDNTVLVLTADHATYIDNDYTSTMKNSKRTNSIVGQIPLSIYHKGVKPEKIDVEGRNSINMVPTLLDYIDISSPNYFLGTSLFSKYDNGNPYQTIFVADPYWHDTYNGKIVDVDLESDTANKIKTYLSLKLK